MGGEAYVPFIPGAKAALRQVLRTAAYFNDREYTPTLDGIRAKPHTIASEVLSGNLVEA